MKAGEEWSRSCSSGLTTKRNHTVASSGLIVCGYSQVLQLNRGRTVGEEGCCMEKRFQLAGSVPNPAEFFSLVRCLSECFNGLLDLIGWFSSGDVDYHRNEGGPCDQEGFPKIFFLAQQRDVIVMFPVPLLLLTAQYFLFFAIAFNFHIVLSL